jgi:hypothetical protein
MSERSKKYKNKLNFRKFLGLFWEYLNQPLLESDSDLIFDIRKFNQYFQDIQFLEYCWQLDFQPDSSQSGI